MSELDAFERSQLGARIRSQLGAFGIGGNGPGDIYEIKFDGPSSINGVNCTQFWFSEGHRRLIIRTIFGNGRSPGNAGSLPENNPLDALFPIRPRPPAADVLFTYGDNLLPPNFPTWEIIGPYNRLTNAGVSFLTYTSGGLSGGGAAGLTLPVSGGGGGVVNEMLYGCVLAETIFNDVFTSGAGSFLMCGFLLDTPIDSPGAWTLSVGDLKLRTAILDGDGTQSEFVNFNVHPDP